MNKELLEKIETFLVSLSNLCPSNEGLGGHAPIQAFIMKGQEARELLNEIKKDEGKELSHGYYLLL